MKTKNKFSNPVCKPKDFSDLHESETGRRLETMMLAATGYKSLGIGKISPVK